ncbi:MAG TPA: patatin-like phospholipase family protein [Lacipirellulaceae bacterium]|nr:patatin-like phospholipase family protein [Lacipirellulaceae bacterium]
MTANLELRGLLQLHPCVEGLDAAALDELSQIVEVVRCDAGHIVFHPQEAITSVSLVINGRLQLQLRDTHGKTVVERVQGRGGQVGGLAAALGEPQPFTCTAIEPCLLLRLPYVEAVEFARKHDAFRVNFARLTADAARQAILRDRRPKMARVVAFFHSSERTRAITRRLLKRLVELGESPLLITDRSLEAPGVSVCPLIEQGQPLAPEEVRRRAADWLPRGRVVFDVNAGLEPILAARTMDACEQIYWCVAAEELQSATGPLEALLASAPSFRNKVRLVWRLAAGEIAPLAPELRRLTCGDVKVCLETAAANQGPLVGQGVERLVHLLRGLQIGVALGGGAARGMAHLGVLRALERSGIVVDMIAGTSAGAMTGICYAAGLATEFLVKRFVEDLRPAWLFRRLPRGEQWNMLYKYRTGQFDPMLRKYLKSTQLEQMYVPMNAITVDLISGRDVVRSRGDAVDGILESINLPLLSAPINRDGESLVDGGLINNVPANVLAARGCNFVIAVSVTAKMETEFAQNRPDTPASRMRRASTIQTLLRSFLVQSHSINSIGVQTADFIIEPDVTRFELSEFGRAADLADVGDVATEAALPQLKAMLHRVDPELFSVTAAPQVDQL